MKGRHLITTDDWFVAPDGKQYKSVWGNVQIVSDNVLGIKTNSRSTNWYAKIGAEKTHVIVAGCQIHYAVKCEERPFEGDCEDWTADATNGVKRYISPSRIYFAEQKSR